MAEKLRHRIAKHWLRGLRLARWVFPFSETESFRTLIFHDIPEAQIGAFERLIEYIKEAHGVLSPDEAQTLIGREGRRVSTEAVPCLLTFDDGFKSNFKIAREILPRHGVRGLFFVCPGLMNLPEDERRGRVLADVLLGRPPDEPEGLELMSWDDLRELSGLGHAVGSHTLGHRALPRLDARALTQEVAQSAEEIHRRLGRRPDWFAYPFGDIDSIDAGSLKIIGGHYRFCRSGIRGLNGSWTSPFAILSDAIDLQAPFEYQQLVLEGGLDWLYRGRRAALGKKIAGAGLPGGSVYGR